MNVTRYIEVYDNLTDELIASYEIILSNEEAITYINPDDDDEYAVFSYELNENQVISLGGMGLISLYADRDVSFHSACYQD